MEFIQPRSWSDALAAKAAHPDALPLAGRTDLIVEMNSGRNRPPALRALTRVPELTQRRMQDGRQRIGALRPARARGDGAPHARLVVDRVPGALACG
jgi:CO/xanthine dehydrogenase FAD-binding subunit